MRPLVVLTIAMGILTGSAPGATHTIVSSGFSFSPPALTVAAGDTITFSLLSFHNAVEVSLTTWNAGDTTSNGGFVLPFGGGTVVPSVVGTYYYVCQVHAFMGMKGTITVTPALPPPNTITVNSLCDRDGNLSTAGDRIPKNWSLKLFKDSVGSGIVVGSVASGTTFTANNLPAGTYVAVEEDSISWTHLSVSVDGISQGATGTRQWSMTVTSGETHVIDFLNFTLHAIISSGFSFLPDSLTVYTGDTVRFILDPMHTAREVSQSAWLANDTTSNGGFDLPSGGGAAFMTAAGIHYYVCVPHAPIGMKGRIIVPGPPPFITIGEQLLAGWNMVSLPVRVADGRPSIIFPSPISPAFSYEGHYVAQTSLSNGLGYWLKFASGVSGSVTGLDIALDSVDVAKGWNMIGSISRALPRTAIVSNPTGIISSSFFGYNGAYFIADTIRPGKGYWVRTSLPGRLFLDSSLAGPIAAKTGTEWLATVNRLTIRDAIGREQMLFIIGENGDRSQAEVLAGLPPAPPAGGFDVRFSSGEAAIVANPGRPGIFPIAIASAQYPLTVTWEMQAMKQGLFLALEDIRTELRGQGSLTVVNPGQSLSIVTASTDPLPAAYALYEAFPNPFNPSTTIRYALPVESRVVLRIYNIIGQLVVTLKDEVQAPGVQAVSWKAGGVASGMYFVRIDAISLKEPRTSFARVTKVLLQQ